MIEGFRCAVCGASVPIETVWPWRCPNASASDRHHVLYRVAPLAPMRPVDDADPLVAFDAQFAWSAFAAAHGMDSEGRRSLVGRLHADVAAVDGTGLHATPFARSAELSEALGFERGGGIWVKDETGQVAGSHKARHLVGILLHLLAAEALDVAPSRERPELAIASCGNAALAAATLARAVDWPLRVFVPPWADPGVLARLAGLGAALELCPRSPGDPPGDPCVHAFRRAVDGGAIPFTVQGPENGLCLDTGRTIGFEVIESLGHFLDRVFVQVGGGALATSFAQAADDEGIHPCLHAVQAVGCAPLERAWRVAMATDAGGLATAARRWDQCMWPWEDEPRSIADGILDDETYDWLGIVRGMAGSGGGPVVVTEEQLVEAHRLAGLTGIPVSPTGAAGLAGLLAIRSEVADGERVAVLFTGRQH